MMYGDFSRGFTPDRKRGQSYRRVLLQQGRALLDSDIAALVDAEDQLIRDAVRFTACRAGSPDLGFLVTPGELLALYDGTLGQEFSAAGGGEAARDYTHKYLDRLPGLRVSGTGGTVTSELRRALVAATDIRLWVRADDAVAASVNGDNFAIAAGPDYQAVDVTVSGPNLTFAVDASAPYWVALVEVRNNSGIIPSIHSAAGSYEIDGLIAHTDGGEWPSLLDPAGSAMIDMASGAVGDQLAAYLEVSERHISAVEDAGILEEALGGDHDTTTRTRTVAQIKLASVDGLTLAEVAASSFLPDLPDGLVRLGVAAAIPIVDPCDIPVPGGYTGPENRLYRFEVHNVTAGGGGETLFKWSRENGSELFRAIYPDRPLVTDPIDRILVEAHRDLRDGDLVELLSEAVDLGDEAQASLSTSGLRRPLRSQGRLIRLSGGQELIGSNRVFTFRDPLTEAIIPSIDPTLFGEEGVKIRRWSGLITRAGVGADSFELEHGINADVSGNFEQGDYWQYEARTNADNANGPAAASPRGADGPERLFAPLALIEITAAGSPVNLLRWLDTRFPRLCEIEADDVSYDGGVAGTDADTVQEALDELFTREVEIIEASCGEIIVRPGDDLQAAIDLIPDNTDARICIANGDHIITQAVDVRNKGELIIGGNGAASFVRNSAARPIFRVENCRKISMRDFRVGSNAGLGSPLIHVIDCPQSNFHGMIISARGEVFHGSSALRVQGVEIAGTTKITDCEIEVDNEDTAILVLNLADSIIRDNRISTRPQTIDVQARLTNNDFLSQLGRILIDRLQVGNVDDEVFVGGAVAIGTENAGQSRVSSALNEWGQESVAFSTPRMLADQTLWEAVIEANPVSGAGTAPIHWAMAEIRRLRKNLIREIFGETTPAQIPASVSVTFSLLGNRLNADFSRATGHTGIRVVASRGLSRVETITDALTDITDNDPRHRTHISGNRINGFYNGIDVASSNGGGMGNDNPNRSIFSHEVAIDRNVIVAHAPVLFGGRHRSHGIYVGNAVSASVWGNRIRVSAAPNDGIVPYGVGIELWGHYGPLLQVQNNFCEEGIFGVSVTRLNSSGAAAPGATWSVSENAYFGSGTPEIIV